MSPIRDILGTASTSAPLILRGSFMLGGFDPRLQDVFFRRRRGRALIGALLVHVGALGLAYRLGSEAQREVEVELEPEIQDFAVDREELQPEVEDEPPPPPPPDAKVEIVDEPRPKPKRRPPKEKMTEAPEETARTKAIEVGPGRSEPGGTGTGEPTTSREPKVARKPGPKAEPAPKPTPKPKVGPKVDPTKPIDRPEKATAPKARPDNPKPAYPAELKDKGITGSVLIKLHVHRDGTVRGAKVLRKTNNASTDEEKKRADALFLQAVIAVVKKWTYEPAELDGEPITVWHKVNIPFSLTGGD